MDISDIILINQPIKLSADESKIPWDAPDFSQRMLDNHLSQEHDWASRKLAIIEQQVDWIAQQLSANARVLDLGCGPGFYSQLLAQRGFYCTGVDFSPASIEYARQQSLAAGLNIEYQQQDVREYSPAQPFDFIIMTFGEINVFSATEARDLLRRCAQWLAPGGKFLVEVHDFDEIKRQGQAEPSWQRCPQGLFLATPHLLLTENIWDEQAQTSSTLFWAIEENGVVTRFGNQMTAWRDAEYQQLLTECGFHLPQRVDITAWPVSKTFEGKLFALLTQVSD